uniref:Heat shock protein 12B n=1 Tax=Sphaerodactylus townsendi TaxID=933632 RepID=A0ACB8E9G2_9SAUR
MAFLPTREVGKLTKSSAKSRDTNGECSRTPSPSNSPRLHNESCSIAPLTPSQSPRNEIRTQRPTPFSVVVAIDFGTTSSGYAFSFANDPEAIHMMRKWEGGDPGIANQKTPTSLLLTPEGSFHSFGYTARDYYHDLDPEEARDWLYFEKFKMKIHSTSDLTMKTELEAVNGKKVLAWEVFAHALRFFKWQALQELKDQCPALPEKDAIRWVITVPAIWKQPAKQFMREAAYLAGLVPSETPEQLLIALEPEAASIYCRKLRLNQLIDLSYKPQVNGLGPDLPIDSSFRQAREQLRRSRHSRTFLVESGVGELWSEMQAGDRYIVADCGGGTVDLTVHQIEQPQGTLKELYKASGGPYGAVGVDLAFEKLLCQIFSEDFIATFKAKRPAAWVDLTIAFEARKRTAAPRRNNPLNISLPFSFIDFYRKHRGQNVETALKRSSVNLVKWFLPRNAPCDTSEAMNELFPANHLPRSSLITPPCCSITSNPPVAFAANIIPYRTWDSPSSKGRAVRLDPTIVRYRSPHSMAPGAGTSLGGKALPGRKLHFGQGREEVVTTDIFGEVRLAWTSVGGFGRRWCRGATARALGGQRKIIINVYCCAADST